MNRDTLFIASKAVGRIPILPATIFLTLLFAFCEMYVAKYSVRISPKLQLPLLIGYPVLLFFGCCAYIRVGRYFEKRADAEKLFSILYVIVAVATMTISIVSIIVIPRETLNVDRWSALTYFWDAAFKGDYPYSVITHTHRGNNPSGLPGLMLLALPFYLLGEVGYMQPFGYSVFFALFFLVSPLSSYWKTGILLFFVSLPPVLWELTVRSDFGTNIIMVSGAIIFFTKKNYGPTHSKLKTVAGTAVLFGFLLSTRLILLFPFLLMSPLLVDKRKVLLFWIVTGATTALTLLPFYFWDTHLFMYQNPLVLNGNKSPLWVSVSALLFAIIGGFYLKSSGDRFFTAGILSTFVVGISFYIGLKKEGFRSILYTPEYFDFFYFHAGIIFMFIAIVLYLHTLPFRRSSGTSRLH